MATSLNCILNALENTKHCKQRDDRNYSNSLYCQTGCCVDEQNGKDLPFSFQKIFLLKLEMCFMFDSNCVFLIQAYLLTFL